MHCNKPQDAEPRPSPAPPADAPTPRRAWLDGWLVFLVFLVAGGDPAPHRNEAHYLTRLKHYWDPDWCAGDFFLETPDAHFTVVWLCGWLTLFLSLEATAWAGRLLSWALLAWGWARLCRRVAPYPGAAPLSAALLVVLTEQTHFAGEWVIGGFEAKTLAYGVVFLGLADWLDGRWNRAWVLLGAATALHALVGGWSVICLLGVWAFAERRRPPLRMMAPGLVAGGALSLLGVAPALFINSGTPPEVVAEANQIYVFQRLSHHLAPLTKPTSWIAERATRFLIGLALFGALSRGLVRRRGGSAAVENPVGLRRLTAFACATLALSATGLAIEIALGNHPELAAKLLRYYFFRMADIAPAIASALMLVAAIGEGLRRRDRRAAIAAWGCVAVCVAHLGPSVARRAAAADAPADIFMRDHQAWADTCEWIRRRTAADAVFVVPRATHTFKWRTGRAEVVNYKDVPQNADGLVAWWRRFQDVYRVSDPRSNATHWTPSLARLGAARLREIGRGYGADYALDLAPNVGIDGPDRYRASLPVVHRAGPFTLYDLRPPASRPERPTSAPP